MCDCRWHGGGTAWRLLAAAAAAAAAQRKDSILRGNR